MSITKNLPNGNIMITIIFLIMPIYIGLSLLDYTPWAFTSLFLTTSIIVTFLSKKLSYKGFKIPRSKNIIFALIVFLYILTVQVLNVAYGDTVDRLNRSFFKFNFGNLINYINWSLCGLFTFILIYRNKQNNIFLYIWMIMSFVYILNVDTNTFQMNFYKFSGSSKSSIYLTFADLYAFTSIFIIASQKTLKRTLIFLTISIIILYFLNSRSSMILLTASITLPYILYGDRKKITSLVLLLSISVTVILFYKQSIINLNPRMFSFLSNDILLDGSLIGRALQFKSGFLHIAENPFFGSYDLFVKEFNSTGAYMHNIISYWQVYGLLVFTSTIYLLIILPLSRVLDISKLKKFTDMENIERTLIILFFYITLQLLFSRSYAWPISWFIFGFSIIPLKNQNHVNNGKSQQHA